VPARLALSLNCHQSVYIENGLEKAAGQGISAGKGDVTKCPLPSLHRDFDYVFLECFKPKLFCDFEHIFVKGAEDNVLFPSSFPEIKSSGNMNGIKAFATCEFFVFSNRISKRLFYGLVKNIIQQIIENFFFFVKPSAIKVMCISFIVSLQRNVRFYFEKNGTNSCFAGIPDIPSIVKTFFVKQNSEQQRRIKIRVHNLKSVGTRVFVSRPPIGSCFWSFRHFDFFNILWGNNSASSGFFFKPFFESLLMSNFYPCNRGSADFCFLNSGSLHIKNIEKEFPSTKGVSQ